MQTVHHIIADGWSVPPMLRALLAEYHAPGSVYPLGGFPDYVRRLAGRDDDESDRVWREQLAELPGPSLVAEGHTPSDRFADTAVEPEDDVDAAARSAGVPLSVAVHSAWAVTLGGLLHGTGRGVRLHGVRARRGRARHRGHGGPVHQHRSPCAPGGPTPPPRATCSPRCGNTRAPVLPHQHVSLARIGRQAGAGPLFDTLVVFDVATDVGRACGGPTTRWSSPASSTRAPRTTR